MEIRTLDVDGQDAGTARVMRELNRVPAPGVLRAMQWHVEALFARDPRAPSRLLQSNEWDARPPPWLFLGRTAAGNLWRFRTGLAPDAARALAAVCQREPVLARPPPQPRLAGELAAVLHAHGIAATPRSGPAFWLPPGRTAAATTAGTPSPRVVALSPDDGACLHGGLADWIADLPHRQPIFGVLQAERGGDETAGEGNAEARAAAVAICASVRITRAAHEAGVETMPAARGQGHARAVVAAWAAAVRMHGALPMYSTSWDNLASRRVAAALDAVCFGVDFQLS